MKELASMYKTPLLVETVLDFEKYLRSLTKGARRDARRVFRINEGLVWKEVPFDRDLVEEFMEVWSKQIIHGNEEVTWAFGIGYVCHLHEQGCLKVFGAFIGKRPLAVQFVEVHGDYVECHPPMWDKFVFADKELAKFMWFSLIKWACENKKIRWLDLGGGHRGTWRELIRQRKKHPRIAYKWLYVPKSIREGHFLEDQPNYLVKEEDGKKWLISSSEEHSEG